MGDQHGMIGNSHIEVVAIDGPWRFAVVVEEPGDPLAGYSLLRTFAKRCLDGFDGILITGHFLQMIDSGVDRMRVRIVETR